MEYITGLIIGLLIGLDIGVNLLTLMPARKFLKHRSNYLKHNKINTESYIDRTKTQLSEQPGFKKSEKLAKSQLKQEQKLKRINEELEFIKGAITNEN